MAVMVFRMKEGYIRASPNKERAADGISVPKTVDEKFYLIENFYRNPARA